MFSYIYFILNFYLQHILAVEDEGIDSRKAFVVAWSFLFTDLAFSNGEILKISFFLLSQNLPHNPEGMKQTNCPSWSYFQQILFEIPRKQVHFEQWILPVAPMEPSPRGMEFKVPAIIVQ